jgi:hypothetical protein
MKQFCFTVDDNIRFFREIAKLRPKSLFEHPYLAMYKRLNERFGLKVQLNLFFEDGKGFCLSDMPDAYRAEWAENSDWLKLSFHARKESDCTYEFSDYETAAEDCERVQSEILRFAAPENLATTTTIHYCYASKEARRALRDQGVRGLLGLYGGTRVSYENPPEACELLRKGECAVADGFLHAGIDIVLNQFSAEDILLRLARITERSLVKVMIHEQYFYPDYPRYQADFEEKLSSTFAFLCENGFASAFFEESIKD